MFPIDFWFNTLKFKVTVTSNVDSQCVNLSKCVNLVQSLTRVWLGPAFSNLIKTFVMWSRYSHFDLAVNGVKVKVTVTFNIDFQYLNLVQSITRVWFGPAFHFFFELYRH